MFSKPCLLVWTSVLSLAAGYCAAGTVVRTASGNAPAGIQLAVDQFRSDLGDPDNGATPGSQGVGRREINWDGVPDNFAAPNLLPFDFFNRNSPRGVKFFTLGTGFQVSGRAGVAPVEFDNLNPTYSSIFQTFSPPRLFTVLGNNSLEVHFFVPGNQNRRATVHGFGAVFTDVDRPGLTTIEYFDRNGVSLHKGTVPRSANGGLSFLGVSFNAGERVAKVRITNGNAELNARNNDGRTIDVVSMDDFIYGEPRP
jgi:hypothetical protein